MAMATRGAERADRCRQWRELLAQGIVHSGDFANGKSDARGRMEPMLDRGDGMTGEWSINIFVPGRPKAQPRTRATARNGRAFVYDPGTADDWKSLVMLALRSQSGRFSSGEPVKVFLQFFMPRPKRLCRAKDPAGPIPHTAKPDADNLAKAVMDAASVCGVWGDDRQVAGLYIEKYYTSKKGDDGMRIQIATAEGAGK